MILFIDDEKQRMDSYAQELVFCGYDVVFKENVDSAYEFFEKKKEELKLVILDFMMPPGKLELEMTRYGLRTGFILFQKIREQAPDLPVLVFTNVFDEEIESKINSDSNSSYYQKESLLPYQLGEIVTEILKKDKS